MMVDTILSVSGCFFCQRICTHSLIPFREKKVRVLTVRSMTCADLKFSVKHIKLYVEKDSFDLRWIVVPRCMITDGLAL